MPHLIKTERLTLRPFNAQDAADVALLVGDLDVARWLTQVPHPYTAKDGASFIARHKDKPFVFAVTARDRLIGCVSIVDELGYWFGKAFWGQGFATEAARAVVGRYFAEDRADRLQSGYVLGNAASRNVLEKLGFSEAQIEPAMLKSSGETVDLQKMHLDAKDWEAIA